MLSQVRWLEGLYRLRGWTLAALFLVLLLFRLESSADVQNWALIWWFAGWGLRLYSSRFIGSHTRGSQFQAQVLATGGPYRWNRNPLYLGNLFIAQGILQFSACFILWQHLFFLGLVFFQYHVLALAEEKFLRLQFTGEYAEYQRITPRWLIKPNKIITELKENPRSWKNVFSQEKFSLLLSAASLFLLAGL